MKRRKQKNKQQRLSENRAPKLSLCMIAKDEADFLAQCLASVHGLVDEIVVGDTGSSDATKNVAQQAGARVVDVPWTGDFATARNAVLSHATGDWVLMLDCDEVLAQKDHAAIRQAMRSQFAYRLTTRNYSETSNRVGWQPCEGTYTEEKTYSGWFPTTKVRLFQNDKRIHFEGALHELVEGSIMQIGGAIADCAVPVHHYGYVEKERKDHLYAEAAQKKAKTNPEDAEAFYQLALSLRDVGKYVEAKQAIGRCIDLIKEGKKHGHYLQPDFVYLVQGDVMRRLEDAAGEEAAYLSAIAVNARCYQALNNLGALKQRMGLLDEALFYYERALKLAPKVETIRENMERIKKQVQPDIHNRSQNKNGGRLTLCMIAKNEAHRIGRCLESVQGLVDEIVVVDTGSTDDTVKIAEKFGARMGFFDWCDDWAAARNESLKLATGDWVMWLDPDDILPRECHAKIREVMKQGLGKKKAYYWVLDDQGYEPVKCFQMRLFPNLPGVKFTMPIHEQVTPSLSDLGVTCEVTDIRVMHTGYSSPEVVSAKQVRYLGIMEKWLEKHPEDYIVRSHAAMTYYIRGPLDRAIENYQKILDDGQAQKDRNLIIQTTATLYLGRCYMRLKQYEKALPYLHEAQKLDDQYLVTNLTLGECYTRLNLPQEAIAALDRALAFENQITFSAHDPMALGYSIRFFKGQNLELMGHLQEAADWYVKATECDPKRGGALGRLSGVYRKLGRKQEAVLALEAALVCEPNDAQHRFNRGSFYLESGDVVAAVQWFKKALEINPDMVEPYLNLGYVARREGDLKTAEQMYHKAIERSMGGYDAQANLAHLLLDQDRFEEAGSFFDYVLSQQPGLLDIMLGLCVVRVAEENLQGVRLILCDVLQAVYGPSVKLDVPDHTTPVDLAMLLAECGRMLVQKNQLACAKLSFLAAHKLADDVLEIALQLAEVYQTTGDYWKAVALLEIQIQKRPKHGMLFQKLGSCYDALGVKEAAQMCRDFSRINKQ